MQKKVRLLPQDLRANQLVEIWVDDGGYKGNYNSRIEDVGEDTLNLAMPTYRGEIVAIGVGVRIEVSFIKNNAIYQFDTIVVNRIRTPIPILIVQKPNVAKRRQRRSWVRVAMGVPFRFRPWQFEVSTNEDEHEHEEVGFIEATTLDLSGGGLKFTTDFELEEGGLLELVIDLPESYCLRMPARVIRIEKMEEPANQDYSIAVEFLYLRAGDQDRLVRMVFDRQRDLIKRGLLMS